MQNGFDWDLYNALVKLSIKGILSESEIMHCYDNMNSKLKNAYHIATLTN